MSATDTVEVYTDDSGEHRWRRVAANGEVIADSSEGYLNKAHAIEMAQRVNGGEYALIIEHS